MTKPKNEPIFEHYLRNVHADQYIGTDDNMIDDFEKWICDLSPTDWILYAEKWKDGQE